MLYLHKFQYQSGSYYLFLIQHTCSILPHYLQGLLDAATCASSSNNINSNTNNSERVTFAPVGSVADGYTSAIVHSVCNSNNTGDVRYAALLLHYIVSIVLFCRQKANHQLIKSFDINLLGCLRFYSQQAARRTEN